MNWPDAETGVDPKDQDKSCTVLSNFMDNGKFCLFRMDIDIILLRIYILIEQCLSLVIIVILLRQILIPGKSAMIFPAPNINGFQNKTGMIYKRGSFAVSKESCSRATMYL